MGVRQLSCVELMLWVWGMTVYTIICNSSGLPSTPENRAQEKLEKQTNSNGMEVSLRVNTK
jgi:hypothetical protein